MSQLNIAREPHLTAADEAMLAGRRGPAAAVAMRVVVALTRTLQANDLIDISSAHIDSCLYHGPAGLDFANHLVNLGGAVAVPTTLNVGSVDLLHPAVVRTDTADLRETAARGRELMNAYTALGCRPSFTCAPYQLPERPAFGANIAWAESNAIVFANSVLGARTDRYGDFLDICAAITGRAPRAGLHLTENRRAEIVLDCSLVSPALLRTDLAYPLLGYLAGSIASMRVPVFTGLPSTISEDRLKALGAAAASSGGIAMFHVVGVTPEAPTLTAALQQVRAAENHRITDADLNAARAELSSVLSGRLDAVNIGTPHASVAECGDLAAALTNGPPIHPDVTIYLSTGRAVAEQLRVSGQLRILQHAGVKIVLDTCTYVTSILHPSARVVMTTSGKWAHYAPTNIGVQAVLGSLEECVASARAGRVLLQQLPGSQVTTA